MGRKVKVTVPMLIEDLAELKPVTVAELMDKHRVTRPTIQKTRQRAIKEGFHIIWTSEGYLLIPTKGMIKSKQMILSVMDYSAIVRTIREAWDRKRVEAKTLEALIPPTLVSSIYLKAVKEPIAYVAGDLEEMQDHLSKVHRKTLKTMAYSKPENGDVAFLQTRYWSIVRAAVINRVDGGKCEYCNQEQGSDVHHNTYEHHGWEDEHLDDLIYVCRPCHEMLEEQKDG